MPFQHGLVVTNDHARQTRQQMPSAWEQLAATGLSLTHVPLTREPLQARLAELRRGGDVVIVAGGDGTMNGCIDAIVALGLPFAILPLGTANDLARTLGIPSDIPAACKLIAAGCTQRIDLGWVNGKHFFNVASLGLSVAITQNLSREIKRRLGPFAYCATALKVLTRYRPFSAEIYSGGECLKVKTVQIAVGNGRFYGGGMQIAHDATIDDQLLDLYSIEVDHWLKLFPLIKALRSGRLAEQQRIRTFKTTELRVITRRPRRINTDGEITSSTPAIFRVIPRAVEVCVPTQPSTPDS